VSAPKPSGISVSAAVTGTGSGTGGVCLTELPPKPLFLSTSPSPSPSPFPSLPDTVGSLSGACPDFFVYSSRYFNKLLFVTVMSMPVRRTSASCALAKRRSICSTSLGRRLSSAPHLAMLYVTEQSGFFPSMFAAIISCTRQKSPYAAKCLSGPLPTPLSTSRAIFSSFHVAVICLSHFMRRPRKFAAQSSSSARPVSSRWPPSRPIIQAWKAKRDQKLFEVGQVARGGGDRV
jgi:hypothetical protein